MSAFIVSPGHVRVLGAYHAMHALRMEDPRTRDPMKLAQETAMIFWQENIRSVRFRYPDDKWDTLPGPVPLPVTVKVTRRDFTMASQLPAINIVKLCHCLDYQSCETDDWRDTEAYRRLRTVEANAVREVPGYDTAPWDLEDGPQAGVIYPALAMPA